MVTKFFPKLSEELGDGDAELTFEQISGLRAVYCPKDLYQFLSALQVDVLKDISDRAIARYWRERAGKDMPMVEPQDVLDALWAVKRMSFSNYDIWRTL